MTIYWANIYENNTSDAVGYIYRTEQLAKDVADDGAVTVPIEIPDPVHVWKVGDWFQYHGAALAWRLTDLVGPHYAWATRRSDGLPRAESGSDPAFFDGMVPCEPPDWFINQQNEAT